MKKLVLFLIMVVLLPSAAFAANRLEPPESEYSCVPAYDLTPVIARFFTSVSTANFWAEQYGEMLAKRLITNSFDTKVKVNIKSYGPADLKAGRFKSLEVNAKNLNADGTYLTSLDLKTLCKFNYVVPDEKNNSVIFKEELPLSFHVVLNEEDLNKTMKTAGYDKIIDDLNNIASKAGGIKIQSTQVRIKNDKFYYTVKILIPFVKRPQEIVITSNLKVEAGKVKFDDTKLANSKFTLDLSNVAYALNYLNPLDYSLKIVDNKDASLKVKTVSIIENKIVVDGIVVVPKDK
jgi:hypothetical protein